VASFSDPLKDLHGIGPWVRSVAEATWGTSQVEAREGEQATKSAFRASVARHHMLWYFGHGTFDPQSPMASGLCLSDGILTAEDLLGGGEDESPACELVLMLACSGSRMDVNRRWAARELLGVSSAFLQRGVTDVVGGLWPLWMPAAKHFARTFVTELGSGRPAGEAYLSAQRGLSRVDGPLSNPYFWGGIQLTGGGKARITATAP
jgi:CHAT domain-containing protein